MALDSDPNVPMEHQSRGLFDGFEFRRTPSGDEIETALTEGVISLDTNILLNLYRYEDTARDEFLAVLRQMKNRLFVTDQVATEFWRNRESVLGDRDSEGRKAREALEKAQTSAQNAIGAWANRLGVDDEKRSSLLNSLAEAIAATTVEIGEVTAGSRHSFDTNEDELLETIGQLVDGRVGVEAAADQQERDVSEGKRRAKERIPPGFADDDKDGDGIAGDYLVWRQSLRFAQSEGVDWLVFVSDDVKADWRRDEGASNPRARPELEREAWLDAGCRLLMLKSTALLRMAKGVLGLEVSEGTFTAVSSVATAHDQRWSASNIDEFVDLLAIRRPELADVVQRAAELGGTIDRSTVYEICGFDSDRKLNRFTMPATGLARQMTEDGDLPEGLDEPIWALYEGTGKAVGFGVPEEFVDFFAE